MPELVLLADDLTGAAEAAATFLLRTTRIAVLLAEPDDSSPLAWPSAAAHARVVAVDTDSRRLGSQHAAARVASVAAHVAGIPVLKKVDSLLRGNLAAEVGALRDQFAAPPVVATALPAASRAVIDAVVHVRGKPLHRTDLWHAEGRPSPPSILAALAPLDTVAIGLPVIRQGSAVLARALTSAAADGRVAVCDAVTDADLDTVHAASHLASGRPLLVGSAGLAAAAARAFPPEASGAPGAPGPEGAHLGVPVPAAVLVVVGTVAKAITAQLAALEPLADVVVRLDPQELLGDADAARDLVSTRVSGSRCAAVTLDASQGIQPALAPRLAAALADAVAPTARDGRSLVLTGGETARSVLSRLGVRVLHPRTGREGAVTSVTEHGQIVVTRPGSFGGRTSLVELVTQLLSSDLSLKEPT